MKTAIYIKILFVALLLEGCNVFDIERMSLKGLYLSSVDEHLDDDIPCDVHLDMKENFDVWRFSNNVDLNVTFYLDDAFDFPDLTLNYEITVNGDWDYKDSLLIVSVDTTSFCCNYVDSSAKSATEESMVRQIRKNIIAGELMPRVRKQVIDSSERKVRVYNISQDSLVVEHPITHQPHVMIRNSDK